MAFICTFVCITHTVAAATKQDNQRKDTPVTWTQKGALSLLELFRISPSDNLLCITYDEQIARACIKSGAKNITIIGTDESWCTNLAAEQEKAKKTTSKKDSAQKSSTVTVFCRQPQKSDFDTATAVIIAPRKTDDKAEVFFKSILEKLPDGTNAMAPFEFTESKIIRRVETHTLAATPLKSVLMYQQKIERPTIEEAIADLYSQYGITGYNVAQEDVAVVREAGGDPTYGEITFPSKQKLFFEYVPLTKNDVFYDLGSGAGKLVMWVYLATPVKKAVGIELSKIRCELAQRAKKLTQEEIIPCCSDIKNIVDCIKEPNRIIEFRNEDITKADIHDATVIFICATCFPEELMAKLTKRFAQLKDGLRVVTLKKLANDPSLHLIATYKMKMSWSPKFGSDVFVYLKSKPHVKYEVEATYNKLLEEKKNTSWKQVSFADAEEIVQHMNLENASSLYDLGGTIAEYAYLEAPKTVIRAITNQKSVVDIIKQARSDLAALAQKPPFAGTESARRAAHSTQRFIVSFNKTDDELTPAPVANDIIFIAEDQVEAFNWKAFRAIALESKKAQLKNVTIFSLGSPLNLPLRFNEEKQHVLKSGKILYEIRAGKGYTSIPGIPELSEDEIDSSL